MIHFFLAVFYYHQNNYAKAQSEIVQARLHAKSQMLAEYSSKFEAMLSESFATHPKP